MVATAPVTSAVVAVAVAVVSTATTEVSAETEMVQTRPEVGAEEESEEVVELALMGVRQVSVTVPMALHKVKIDGQLLIGEDRDVGREELRRS